MDVGSIKLKGQTAFSRGGNRLCFVHPENLAICLKVHQPHRTPRERRRQKKDFRRFRSLAFFDENLQESLALTYLKANYPEIAEHHLPKVHGLVETDLGQAISVDLIRDEDGLISQTVEQYVWEFGLDGELSDALDAFAARWISAGIRTRDLIPHNIVFRRCKTQSRLILIDGFGRPWAFNLLGSTSHKAAQKRILDLRKRVDLVLQRKAAGQLPTDRIIRIQRNAH